MAKLIPLKVLYATSCDNVHLPENAGDQSDGTFWSSTGLFPQEIAFSFAEPCQIMRVSVITGKVQHATVYAALNKECSEWEKIDEFYFQAAPLKQFDEHQINMHKTAYGIKLSIDRGWGPFVAIYSLSVEGPIVAE